jgi:hypothetical protein
MQDEEGSIQDEESSMWNEEVRSKGRHLIHSPRTTDHLTELAGTTG